MTRLKVLKTVVTKIPIYVQIDIAILIVFEFACRLSE